MPHFLDIDQIKTDDLQSILETAKSVKSALKQGEMHRPLLGKQLAMIFEKPSTRTRASFEVGINQLGGSSIVLNTENTQIGRGETIEDTAKVLSRYVDIMMIRCFSHNTLTELAKHADVPVINGLTDYSHPCQIMADIMTFEEHRGSIKSKKIAWIGDGNNVANSWIHAAVKFGFTLNIATPEKLKSNDKILAWAKEQGGDVNWTNDPKEAVKDTDLVNTDTWVSMGMKNADERMSTLKSYQVNEELMSHAKSEALFMHCLPAHRGDEVSDDVMDGKQSVVFDEAENRLHIQKAIMLWCLS